LEVLNAFQLKMVTDFHFYALLRSYQISNARNPPLFLQEDALIELTSPQGVMLQAARSP